MPSDNLVTLDNHALRTIMYVRESMESASSLAVPGTAGLVMGVVGSAASTLAQLPSLQSHWLLIWLVAAVVALSLGGGSMLRQARRNGRAIYSGSARKFLLCLCPALLAGAALTLSFTLHGLQIYLAGAWLLLYGCAVASASATTSRSTLRLIAAMGSIFMLLGAITLELPAELHNAMLGIGFGGMHLLFGALIGRATHVE